MWLFKKLQKRHDQYGATVIEFAIVFPLLFGVFWAIVSYALPFFTLQVMNHATAEAARVALRADPLQLGCQETAIQLAQNKLVEQLTVLPSGLDGKLVSSVTPNGNTLLIQTLYSNYANNPIIPILNLPGLGPIPNISGDLRAEARVNLPSCDP